MIHMVFYFFSDVFNDWTILALAIVTDGNIPDNMLNINIANMLIRKELKFIFRMTPDKGS